MSIIWQLCNEETTQLSFEIAFLRINLEPGNVLKEMSWDDL